MKQLNIAVDIDDTITNTFDYLMPYIAEFYDIELKFLKENNISYSNLPKEMREKELEFSQKYYDEVIPNTPVKEDASEYIRKIRKLGHKITIITARIPLFYSDPYKTSSEYLRKHNIEFDELICTFDKVGICKEQKIDILVDDSVAHCNHVKEAGITPLLFASKANEDNQEHYKVYSWQDVYHYIANHS